MLPSPITDITPLPNQLPPNAFYRHLSSRSATGAVINGTGPEGCLPELDMFPLLQVMCLWYMCFCAEVVFFFCSHTVLPMEHSLGVKHFFSSSLSSCKCCIFLTYPVFLFCLPRCHMYVVYVWTGGWLISLVLVTSDNKGLLLLLLLLYSLGISCSLKTQ